MKTLEQLDSIQLRLETDPQADEEGNEHPDSMFEQRRAKRKKLVKDILVRLLVDQLTTEQADLDRLDTCASQIHELLGKLEQQTTQEQQATNA